MYEVTAFLAQQPALPRAGLYAALLLFWLCAGGLTLTLVARSLDRVGELLTANPNWQTRGAISKEETLLLISVLLYAKVLLSMEPPLRVFASVAGNALFASLVLAPIAGAVLYSMRGLSSPSCSRRSRGRP